MKMFPKEMLTFLKKNYLVVYSLGLTLVIPAILFISSYYSIANFEKNFNHLLQTKALLLEDVFIVMATEETKNLQTLQHKIEQLKKENNDIAEIKVLAQEEDNSFKIIAASNLKKLGQIDNDFKNNLAIGTAEGIAGLEAGEEGRLWEVAKAIKGNGGKQWIIKTSLSLQEVDKVFRQSVKRAYWALALSALVLILLVANYARLSRYAFLFNKIKEIDQMKDNFISMASHELRTPLTAIGGFTELLELDSQTTLSKDGHNYLNKIKISTERLKLLVNDILEVSRLEQNRIPFKMKIVSALDVVQKVIKLLENQARGKGLELSIENKLEQKEDQIKIDDARLEQVLINLVGNAIKYTPQGKVKVKLFKRERRVIISVEDTGLGMSAKDREHLFEKFYRIRNKATQQISGTGLGLWIAKQITEKMGGKIEVESMEGVGSKFMMSFIA